MTKKMSILEALEEFGYPLKKEYITRALHRRRDTILEQLKKKPRSWYYKTEARRRFKIRLLLDELDKYVKNSSNFNLAVGFAILNEIDLLENYNVEDGVELQKQMEMAKIVPVDTFIDFNINGFARCIWHNEKTASMKFYKDSNSVYCFGCNKYGDVINVVQAIYKTNFKQALKIILKKGGLR